MTAPKARYAAVVTSILVSLALLPFSVPAADAAYSDYAVASASASLSHSQAGGHADLTTAFTIATDPASESDSHGFKAPYAQTKDLVVNLPPGLIGNPNSVAQCTAVQFATAFSGGGCPNASQVGVTKLRLYQFEQTFFTEPIYNMTPPGGDTVARLGVYAASIPTFINVGVRSDEDYGLAAHLEGLPANALLISATTTIWGVPAAASHDTERQTPAEAFNGVSSSPPRPPGGDPAPFLSNPTRCGVPQEVSVSADSYQLPDPEFPKNSSTARASLPQTHGCDELEFHPSLTVTPTSREAAVPSGLEAELSMPQNETVDGLATSQLRDARVTLPEGMTLASGAADGLASCSAQQVGYKTLAASACPEAAKIGSAEVDVPALSRILHGAIYQRTPESGHLFRIWLVTDELGLHLKIPGDIRLDPFTGQVTSIFLENPQAPLRNLKLHFKGGPRAPLANPGACGLYQTSYEFAPWSGTPTVLGKTAMTIDQGCDTGGFSPLLSAGAINPTAGAFSPFALSLISQTGEQNVSDLEVSMPPGLLAKLAGVAVCQEPQASSGDCPAASQVGRATVASGPGPSPLWIPQPGKAPTAIYLSGPYKGAPYSLSVKVPAQAGPFDLGTVVTRAGIYVDPETTQVTVKSDPLPQLLEGVPVTYRTIHVDVDRPGFTLNPTNCEPMAVRARASSIHGAVANPSSRFQVGSCARLPFKPELSLTLTGSTKRGGHPALRAVLRARRGDANIARAVVGLPHSEFLAQEHIRTICTRVQFAAGTCPAGAVYGRARAISPLLDQPLEGPVYLRSSSHPLPDLVVDLHGPIRVVLVGRIDSFKGGIRSSFDAIPDAPVTKFVLSMQGGKKGLLVNSRFLCVSTNRAGVSLTAQSGKTARQRPALRDACSKHTKKPHSKKHRRQKRL
ncbi:MAG: hypothetical protein ACJ76D_04705 [Solirubrobacterales bacterium]